MTDREPVDLGIFTRTFACSELAACLDAVVGYGFGLAHLSLRSAGLAALPDELPVDTLDAIRRDVEHHGVRLAGVSGTFNAIHPDAARRARETALACDLIAHAKELGTSFVSLSTGTRDPDDMWRGHPGNAEPSAWSDLRTTLEVLLEAARAADVTLGIEPEHNNVVSSAHLARQLLDEVRDERLQIILDAANLVTVETTDQQDAILAEAFDLLASDIAVIHAKDFTAHGDTAAGRGLLHYRRYFELVVEHGITAPVIIHEVEEDDVARARDFVLAQAAAAGLPLRMRS
jgi:sugar phosphate isomerase/epimerase